MQQLLYITVNINILSMSIAWNILAGNGISLIAGVFLILSYSTSSIKNAYKYQFLNALVLAVSSVFFLSWVGVVTMTVIALRNAMVYFDRLTRNWTVFFIVITVILGVLTNTLGLVGFLPIIGIVQITLCNYLLKNIKSIKISFIVNSLFYIIYFLAIFDMVSLVMESVTVFIGLASLIKLINE